jgi:competence protein ComGF
METVMRFTLTNVLLSLLPIIGILLLLALLGRKQRSPMMLSTSASHKTSHDTCA